MKRAFKILSINIRKCFISINRKIRFNKYLKYLTNFSNFSRVAKMMDKVENRLIIL